MPSFGFLFQDERGPDLVLYLESLHGFGTQAHQNAEKQWQPSASASSHANAIDGAQLYIGYCATCHNSDGRTREAWQARFKNLPTNLTAGPFRYLNPSESHPERLVHLAQIAKFGIPATDMPGHEYLSDDDLASLSLWLSQNIR
jgi:cytochrome c oxidase cbb3-type subunit 2